MTTTKTKSKTKQRAKVIGVTDSKRLQELAREIRNTFKETEQLIVSAQERGTAAIASAILCGKALNEAKEIVGHGKWEAWVEKHCKGVSYPTAVRYMRLSKESHVISLKDCKSLRQAYIEVGIIPEIVAPRQLPAPAQPDRVLSAEDKTFLENGTPGRNGNQANNDVPISERRFVPHENEASRAPEKEVTQDVPVPTEKVQSGVPALTMWDVWIEEGATRIKTMASFDRPKALGMLKLALKEWALL